MSNHWRFSESSLRRLDLVHPFLRCVAHEALSRSPCDFAVTCGLRTSAEQSELVRLRLSQNPNSKHLKQSTGYSHAIDVTPFIGGVVEMSDLSFARVARAFQQAYLAVVDSTPDCSMPMPDDVRPFLRPDEGGAAPLLLRWGGHWPITNFGESGADPFQLLHQSRRGGHFVDAFHFELV